MSGLKRLAGRIGATLTDNPLQFHPTPPEVVRALLTVEARRLAAVLNGGPIWEPACGDGRLAAELRRAGFRTVESDISAPPSGTGLPLGPGQGSGPRRRARDLGGPAIQDFLSGARRAPVVVTNPPFGDDGAAFIRRGAALELHYMALLLPLGFFTAAEKSNRDRLFAALTPARIWPLGFRPDWTGQGNPVPMPLAWFVWDWTPGLSRQHGRDPERGPRGEPYARLYAPVRRT
ncbi:hypothetical protein [Parvibaculum sp.]|uniref:hypothetical protein n=1 Tax=Parvibaculum sp. TaxID=2024848 RepID=UPI001DD0FBCA|nr:hypothetical protein [Parvibaculum sp.]MBX3488893.1 hypothetical protein [Parvibaculum sp.]MCW5727225.1 hypothetical protein [Parvibaculum sp.]